MNLCPPNTRVCVRVAITLLISVFIFSQLPATHAAVTFTVNSLLDTPDVTPGDGTCANANGACTLRAAIQEANSFLGDDNKHLYRRHDQSYRRAADPFLQHHHQWTRFGSVDGAQRYRRQLPHLPIEWYLQYFRTDNYERQNTGRGHRRRRSIRWGHLANGWLTHAPRWVKVTLRGPGSNEAFIKIAPP